MNITHGKIARAQKVVLYGPEGIGKSTFASKFPTPIFIDTEGSTSNMDVGRLDKPTSWIMLLQQIEFVKQNKPCETLVIDTIDWAERIAIEHICSKENKTSIEDFGYGTGYIKLEEELGRFLNKLSELVEAGINIVLTAHAQVRKFELPDEMGAFDRYELKLGKKTSARTSSLVKEWADMVLFMNYKTYAIVDSQTNKMKAQGGKRVIHTTHHPSWDAKNRFGLPDELDMDYTTIAHIFATKTSSEGEIESPTAEELKDVPFNMEDSNQNVTSTEITPEKIGEEDLQVVRTISPPLADLMAENHVTLEELQKVVAERGYYPLGTPFENYDLGFVNGSLIGAWDAVYGMIREMKK
ncbi:ATP-binding protein [Listeria sp. ILCC792]|uniref:ATP-binding protein n=1 Tax=Listeria sp. ILCC792 TaxID=1918331 RepID=UPI000B5913D6|nr:ATP-binding protein [Listeria sp. ILCC792]